MAALTPYRVRVRLAPIARLVRVSGLPKVVPGDLAGVALALSLSAGALSVVASLAAATASVSQAAGDIGVGRPMMAATSASAAAGGDLTVVRGLAASTQAVAQTTGTLQVAGGISGASSAASQASGTLTVQRGLAAASFAPAASGGTLDVTVSPTADTAAPSTSAGDLTVARALAASTPALTTTSATLSLAKGLDGAGASTSTATGDLTVARPITTSTSALSATAGTLIVGRALAADCSALSSTAAALTVVKGLSASTLALSAASGTISSAAQEDADAASYLNAQTTPPSATERSLVDALVKGLKTDGVWTSLDRIALLSVETAQAASIDLRSPAKTWTPAGTTTFTANRGIQGDGSTGYLDGGEVWNAAGNQFALNSATLGVWCNLSGANGVKSQIGNVANAARSSITARSPTGNETFVINDSSGDTLMASNGSRAGHRTASRTGSAVKRGYFNGSRLVDLTTASTTTSSANAAILRATTVFTDDRIAVAYSGAGMTDAQISAIHNRFNTYLSAKGAA